MAATTKFSIIARSMSTMSTGTALIKPPLQIFGIDGRYAVALYSAATKMKVLDAVEKDLKNLQVAMQSKASLREAIINPTIKRSLKAAALKDASTKINFSPATGNFLSTLAENGRLKKLESIINAFRLIMAAHRGEVVCEVTTSRPLDADQRSQLESALKKFVKANETILLTAKVDPAIIGGMVVSIGDKYVDMSIASKVKKYTDLISTPI